jgi:hypothetical protein
MIKVLESDKKCQIYCLDKISENLSLKEILWQKKNRLKRIIKRRWFFLKNLLNRLMVSNKMATLEISGLKNLKPGDWVIVKSKEEIKETLNNWNQLKGCAFMEEMWPYCGTKQRVLKRVERFLDERDYLVKKCKGIVLLEGVMCQGTKDFGPCDRSCFYFWREEWLEKIS